MFGTLGGGGRDTKMQTKAQARRAEHEFAYFSSSLPYARRAAGCADEMATAVRMLAQRSRHPAQGRPDNHCPFADTVTAAHGDGVQAHAGAARLVLGQGRQAHVVDRDAVTGCTNKAHAGPGTRPR